MRDTISPIYDQLADRLTTTVMLPAVESAVSQLKPQIRDMILAELEQTPLKSHENFCSLTIVTVQGGIRYVPAIDEHTTYPSWLFRTINRPVIVEGEPNIIAIQIIIGPDRTHARSYAPQPALAPDSNNGRKTLRALFANLLRSNT